MLAPPGIWNITPRVHTLAYTTASIITATKPVIIKDFCVRALNYVRAMAAPHLGQVTTLQGFPRWCGS